MQRTGYYTGKKVSIKDKTFTIGKISGYRGNGEPVYDLLDGRNGRNGKVGEMGNPEIKKNRKKY